MRPRRHARDAGDPVGWGVPTPDALDAAPRQLTVAGRCCRTLAVTGYPRHVTPGWLEPLLAFPGRLDVALHVDPIPTALAADRLRRQLARHESTRRTDLARGRLVDPHVDVAAADAADLAEQVARAETRLFRVGVYLTVWADTDTELDRATTHLRGICAGLLLDLTVTVFRQQQGWTATRPLGVDTLQVRRSMDTAALAAAYPFTTPSVGADPDSPTAVFYGRTLAGGGLVFADRWAADNHNTVILARSGAGKSYLAKLDALRSLYTGVQVFVVDPEDEYAALADAVGGVHLPLGSDRVRLNPLDLTLQPPGPDALTRRALHTHTVLDLLLGRPLTPAERASADRAILSAYAAKGITGDPRTHTRPCPLLADVTTALAADTDPAGPALAAALAPYTTGSYRILFDGPTSTLPTGHLVVFGLRDLPEELKAAGTLLALDVIWRQVADGSGRRRLVVVDEAWLLARDPAGAGFLLRMAKGARKHTAGLTIVTQDAADLLDTPVGQAIVGNAATQILLRQAPQALLRLTDAFDLSDGERAFLLTAPRGHALVSQDTERVAVEVAASPAEHTLLATGIATTNSTAQPTDSP